MSMAKRESTSVLDLHSYAKYLKNRYREHLLHYNSLVKGTPTGGTSDSNVRSAVSLAKVVPVQVERGKVWDDFTKTTLHDSVEDILHLKEPFSFQLLLELLTKSASKTTILLEGAAGIGKTAILVQLLEGWSYDNFLQKYSLVVYLPLWDGSFPSSTRLADILPPCEDVSTTERIAKEIQQNDGDGVLFILDDWQSEYQSVPILSSVALDKSFLPKSNVIVSARSALIPADICQHASIRIEVVGFGEDDRRKVLEKKLGSSDAVLKFVSALESNPVLLSISHIPPLLEALVHTFMSRGGTLPCTLSELVQQYLLHLCNCPSSNLDLLPPTSSVCVTATFSKLAKLAFECLSQDKDVFRVAELEANAIGIPTMPKVLEPVPVSSSLYKFLTPLFWQYLAALRIAQFTSEEQSRHLRELLDRPRLHPVIVFLGGLLHLNHGCLQLLKFIQVLAIEKLGEPSFLVLLQALFEAQKPETCIHLASALSNEIILSSLYMNPLHIQVVGYFVGISSQSVVVKLYMRNCSLDDHRVGILMYHLRQHCSSATSTGGIVLNLQLNRLTPHGTAYIADAMRNGTRLLALDVGNIRPGYNNIRDPGAEHLASALSSDMHLTELCLSNNSISAVGADAIAKMLMKNKTLQKLDIHGNIIGEQGTAVIAKSLKQNSSLRFLNLYCCYTADEGVRALAGALVANSTLKDLNLSKNEITGVGMEALASPLAQNCSLEKLNICSNWIDDSGLGHIARTLTTNTTLISLDVLANSYTDSGRRVLGSCLRENQTLQELRMDCSWIINEELKEINAGRKENGHKQLRYKF